MVNSASGKPSRGRPPSPKTTIPSSNPTWGSSERHWVRSVIGGAALLRRLLPEFGFVSYALSPARPARLTRRFRKTRVRIRTPLPLPPPAGAPRKIPEHGAGHPAPTLWRQDHLDA